MVNRSALVGYVMESLPDHEMNRIEELLRDREEWRDALREILGGVDSGDHTVAAIWRRHRLTCPTREQLGAFLADALLPDEQDYVRFHLDVVACRWCQANRLDLEALVSDKDRDPRDQAVERRRKFFQTSVGELPRCRT